MGSRNRVRQALVELLAEQPFCPTVREVADRASLSASATHRQLAALRARGEIAWIDGQVRTLHLVVARGVRR